MSNGPNPSVVAEGLPVTFRDLTVWRDPVTFGNSYLLNYDFDGTCFSTFVSSGRGPEVSEAYEIAVRAVLGETALRDFSQYGGLSNRAPLDVIQSLVSVEPGLVRNALEHASEYFTDPSDKTDIGLSIIARFVDRGEIGPDDLTLRAITEMLVIRKKEILIPQISADWPRSLNGFDEHWNDLNTRKTEKDEWHDVHTAIVSSGHADFIRKALEVNGLSQPDVYMTDDEMRQQVTPKTKPDPLALELARNAWFNAYLVPADLRKDEAFLASAKRRQMYCGDDVDKDGNMAKNDGIAFIHHNGTPDAWATIGRQIIESVDSRRGFDAK